MMGVQRTNEYGRAVEDERKPIGEIIMDTLNERVEGNSYNGPRKLRIEKVAETVMGEMYTREFEAEVKKAKVKFRDDVDIELVGFQLRGNRRT